MKRTVVGFIGTGKENCWDQDDGPMSSCKPVETRNKKLNADSDSRRAEGGSRNVSQTVGVKQPSWLNLRL